GVGPYGVYFDAKKNPYFVQFIQKGPIGVLDPDKKHYFALPEVEDAHWERIRFFNNSSGVSWFVAGDRDRGNRIIYGPVEQNAKPHVIPISIQNKNWFDELATLMTPQGRIFIALEKGEGCHYKRVHIHF